MARFISNSKTLLRHAKGHHRHRSTKSKWMEIDDVKLLEEHVHRIAVKNASPDWLPFLPGSSFWVPPPPSLFLHKLSISSTQPFFIQGSGLEKQFGNAIVSPPGNGTQVTVQLKLLALPQNLPLSEDDEG